MADVFYKREGTPTSLSALKPNEKFKVYDDLLDGLFPATYQFVGKVDDKFVGLAVNLDTQREVYIIGRAGDDYPQYEGKDRIIICTTRALHRVV